MNKNSMMRNGRKIMIRNSIAVLLLLLMCLCQACENAEPSDYIDVEPSEGQLKVYCINSSGDSLRWENVSISTEDRNHAIYELCNLLKRDPQKELYISAIPENVKIVSSYIGEDGQLVISFSKEYYNMNSIDEVLCRAAVVKTLSQLEGIEFIEFFVEDQPLMLKDIPVGMMSEDDFVSDSGDGAGFKHSLTITLFLADKSGKSLKETVMKVDTDAMKTMEETVLKALIDGPSDSQSSYPVLDRNIVINKVRTYDGICYVDFNDKFLSKLSTVSDEVHVYSVVNTLCELPGITKVRITVNGSERKSMGKVPVNEFMSFRPELISMEKVGELAEDNK